MISCICITKNRPALVERAIELFRAQTYPDKELILCYDSPSDLPDIQDPSDITLVLNHTKTRGAKRNLAIQCSKGDLLATWDDDDWSHPERLAKQIGSLNKYDYCLLARCLIYNQTNGKTYEMLENRGYLANTYVGKKKYLLPYINTNAFEDAQIKGMSNGYLLDEPTLFTYVSHLDNVYLKDLSRIKYWASLKLLDLPMDLK